MIRTSSASIASVTMAKIAVMRSRGAIRSLRSSSPIAWVMCSTIASSRDGGPAFRSASMSRRASVMSRSPGRVPPPRT
ncbi:MAG: hypothetical protein U0575_13095 [Phycisphaerales bacterium]